MAIIAQPGSNQTDELLPCVICGRELPPAHMTVGLVDAAGKQRFACYGHSWDSAKFIVGWALFAVEQRRALAQAALQMEHTGGLHGRHIR